MKVAQCMCMFTSSPQKEKYGLSFIKLSSPADKSTEDKDKVVRVVCTSLCTSHEFPPWVTSEW